MPKQILFESSIDANVEKPSRLKIAHRKTPSELTQLVKQHALPLIHEQGPPSRTAEPKMGWNEPSIGSHKSSHSISDSSKYSFLMQENNSSHRQRYSLALTDAVKAAENRLFVSKSATSRQSPLDSFSRLDRNSLSQFRCHHQRSNSLLTFEKFPGNLHFGEDGCNQYSRLYSKQFSQRKAEEASYKIGNPLSSSYSYEGFTLPTFPTISVEPSRYRHQKHKSINLPPQQNLNFSTSTSKNLQRKNLFSPYVPQTVIPQLIAEKRLICGILRVNKKNRSDAYVITDVLDHAVFISGSRDRNRALNGDFVAVELLDVDELWADITEKTNKKIRKEHNVENLRAGMSNTKLEPKKKDDIEVEGQNMFLVVEEEYDEIKKPLYAGHVVSIIERAPLLQFTGTVGILRPSSMAAKERQEIEKKDSLRLSANKTSQISTENLKIVWFKPTDKRVPLIAIPLEQVPKNFLKQHDQYTNKLFVASLKRWPITSLHPFGNITGQLGMIGDFKSECDGILMNNSMFHESFSEASFLEAAKIFANDDVELELKSGKRVNCRNQNTIAILKSKNQFIGRAISCIKRSKSTVEICVHVTDVAHYVLPGSSLDQDAAKRLFGVNYLHGEVNLFPPLLLKKLNFELNEPKLAFTVSFIYDTEIKDVLQTNFYRSLITVDHKITYSQIHDILQQNIIEEFPSQVVEMIKLLDLVTLKIREQRLMSTHVTKDFFSLIKLTDEHDDELDRFGNIMYDEPGRHIEEEILLTSNLAVAQKIVQNFPSNSILRRQRKPLVKDFETFQAICMSRNCEINTSTGYSILPSLMNCKSKDNMKALQCDLYKLVPKAQYIMSGAKSTNDWSHYTINTSIYTHFVSPYRRYIDLVVHRQLVCSLDNSKFAPSFEFIQKLVDQANYKYENVVSVIEHVSHLYICHTIEKNRSLGKKCLYRSLVTKCNINSINILICDIGIEKRIYLDQLHLRSVKFDPVAKLLELVWIPGIQTQDYKQDEALEGIRNSDLSEAMKNMKLVEKDCIQKIKELDSIMVFVETDIKNHSPPLCIVKPINPFC